MALKSSVLKKERAPVSLLRWNDATIHKFLELYEQNQCLWNPKHKGYRYPVTRSQALDRIIEQMGLPMDRAMLKLKIKNIRTTYHREITRILHSKENGEEEVYTPQLSWFNFAHRFLKNVIGENKTKNLQVYLNLDESECGQEETIDNEDWHMGEIVQTVECSDNASIPLEKKTSPERRKFNRSSLKILPTKSAQVGFNLQKIVRKLDDVAKMQIEPDDEFHTFGMHVANQLRRLPLQRALLLQNKFQELITEERMNAISDENHFTVDAEQVWTTATTATEVTICE
ncbi:hypothetical protein LSTR_LSTR002720 [Laodelphax striatellus]|uniref:MADF domain-containing protein n=1 Tax=Laodelphax striatellus TaxID=195883 RepID=A0A482X6H0_LAOST|nr:hypothetical protein LSTR_LSTR002720 [Laodelphax striatellus]